MNRQDASSIDEETLFKEIHQHILKQAREGRRMNTENELAAKFGVTRYKVRKALSVLTQMGVIERVPKRGMTVNPVRTQNLTTQIQVQMNIANFDIREFIEARLLIEVNILPLAIRRITPALVGRLEEAIRGIEQNAHDAAVADGWDREFHLLLLEACGNRVLQVFSGALVTYFEKTTEPLPQNRPSFFLDMAKNERRLLDAIKAGDENSARAILHDQLTQQVDLLRR